MSIQFRARTIDKTVESYPPTIIGPSNIGWCCPSRFNPLGGSSETKQKCDAIGGYFMPGELSKTKCPLNCAGFLSEIPVPGSCCHSIRTNGIYTPFCANVNSDSECSVLHRGSEEGLKYNYSPGDMCQFDGGDSNCGQLSSSLGNCCTQQYSGNILCSISNRESCFGNWSFPTDGLLSCTYLNPCSGIYFTGITANNCSAAASLNQLQTSTNPLEKLPSDNIIYQGGLYVGIFMPGSPKNTIGAGVYGTPNSGKALNYNARGVGVGSSNSKWILIAATTDYYSLPMNDLSSNPKDISTSIYDGVYNSYQNDSSKSSIYSRISNFSLNGFNDWYLPSQDELAFYFKTIQYGFSIFDDYSPLIDGNYLTSTAFSVNNKQNINNNYFMYSQSAKQETYGDINIVSRKIPQNIRLFRRIYLNP